MIRESDIERYLGKKLPKSWLYLKQTGILGIPDRLIVGEGGFHCFVELKRPSGKLSEIQKYRIEQLKELGHITAVIWSKEGVDEFIEYIVEKEVIDDRIRSL